ncbi:ABC transporter permease [Haloferacaceae archaeon DSL9]
MSWPVVARKDFLDAGRSKGLWLLTALYVIFTVGVAYVLTLFGDGSEIEALQFFGTFLAPAATLIPLTALVIAYKSIVGEVESGSAKFLLSLPHTRRDVVLGKFVGRSTLLCASVLVGLLSGAAALFVLAASFPVADYVAFVVITLFFAVVYTSVAVGVSALATSERVALVLAVGVILVFEFLWGLVVSGIHYLVEGTFNPAMEFVDGQVAITAPDWYFFLQIVTPSGAWNRMLTATIPGMDFQYAASFPDGTPFFLSGWAGFAILLFWLVVPATIGYWRFNRGDI